jgi:hypothetical protein
MSVALAPSLAAIMEPVDLVSFPVRHVAGAVVQVESERTMAAMFQLAVNPLSGPGTSLVKPSTTPKAAHLSLAPSVAPEVGSIAGAPANLIIDRANQTSDATQFVSSGAHHIGALVVGESTTGQFVQSGGSLRVGSSLTVGRRAGSVGTYSMSGGELFAADITIGAEGEGHFQQTGGTVRVTGVASDDPARAVKPGILTVGDAPGSVGEYVLAGGSLYADQIYVGKQGTGRVFQSGGHASFNVALLGDRRTGDGTWSLLDGVIEVAASDSVGSGTPPALVVGNEGWGTFVIRSDREQFALADAPGSPGASLVVRAAPDSQGVVRGWGQIGLGGELVQNGKVIADGLGASRVLNFVAVSSVTNSIDNPRDGGTNGWFARNGGRLLLPPLPVKDDSPLTWGEDPRDPVIDLVNSVRLVPHNVTKPGSIKVSLLDPQSRDFPALPDGIDPVSVWSMESSADFGSIELMIRYDDVQAAFWGTGESDLTLWVYEGGWHPITGSGLTQDLSNHLLSGSAVNPSFFAAAPIPEPATIALSLITAGALMLRRRQRHQHP